jgi:hypothetical protein
MNPDITQFDIIQSKLLQQIKNKQTNKLMLIYEITILNIALINFIMIVNRVFVSIIVGVNLVQSYFLIWSNCN